MTNVKLILVSALISATLVWGLWCVYTAATYR